MRASARRIGAIVGKEFRHLGRDPRALVMVILTPVIQLLLFSYAVSFDVDHVPTIVIDLDQTVDSRTYAQQYDASTFFDVVAHGSTLGDADAAFDAGTAKVAVIIPAGFARTLAAGEKAQVAVLVDGSEPTSAKVSQAYSVALNQLYNQAMTKDWADKQGLDISGFGQLEPRIRTWYNPEHRSSDFLIPGLMVVIIAIVTVQQTAVTLVRERDLFVKRFALKRGALMFGKLLPWTFIAFAEVAMIIGIGRVLFAVPLRGDFWALAVGAALFVFSGLGMGLLISAVAPSLDTANIIAMLLAFLPSFLLSGLAFALDQIPVVLQWVSYAFPARYMVTIARVVFLKGGGFPDIWPELVALAVYGLVMMAISAVIYGRKARA